MKKSVCLLLVGVMMLGCLVFTACGGKKFTTDKDNVDDRLNYISICDVSDQESYRFLEDYSEKNHDWKNSEQVICTIPADLTGNLVIPAEYDGHKVIAVTAESDKNSGITALVVGKNVCYLEGLRGMEKLEKLEVPSSVKYIFDSFSDSESLTTVDCSAGTKYIEDSFNACEALEKVKTASDMKELFNSFCDCPKIKKIKQQSIDEMRGSFNRCEALESVELVGNIKYLSGDFCECPALESIEIDSKGAEIDTSFNQNAGLTKIDLNVQTVSNSFWDCDKLESVFLNANIDTVETSFCDCDALKKMSCYSELKTIKNSFCDCKQLKTVSINGGELQTAMGSFENCPALKEKPESTADIKAEEERKQQAEEDLIKSFADKESDYHEIFEKALKKLADDGAIPALKDDHYTPQRLSFESWDGDYAPEFKDASVRERLFAAPDFELENVVLLSNKDLVYWLEEDDSDPDPIYPDEWQYGKNHLTAPYATDPEKARYLIHYEGYITDVEKEVYTGGYDKGTTTTVVFVVDMKTGEIVHMAAVGSTEPGFSVQIGGKSNVGTYDGIVYVKASHQSANEYIETLLY